jgi:endonuclease/exonuclease/phosphatase family metal-dependent hydrolase
MIRVVSWNVHGFTDGRRRFSPEPALRILASLDPDVVALQEVEDRRWAASSALDWLAGQGGWSAWHAETLVRRGHSYGNAILSRLPVSRVVRHNLSVPGCEPRGALEVDFEATASDGTPAWRLVSAHLGLRRRERRLQVIRLLSMLGPPGEHMDVLTGDLNEWRIGGRLLAGLDEAFGHDSRLRTFPAWRPVLPLDRIWVRPRHRLSIARVERDIRGASDHLPLVADIHRGARAEG